MGIHGLLQGQLYFYQGKLYVFNLPHKKPTAFPFNRLMLFRETVAVYCETHTEHTDPVRASQETHYVSATKPNRLMLFRETVAVCCETHTEHTQNAPSSVTNIPPTLDSVGRTNLFKA
jgi:hypothetical protein